MYPFSLENQVYTSLENLVYEVKVPEKTREKARETLERMLKVT